MTPLAVSVDRVSFRYQKTLVLEEVTLQVKEGEFLALIGPNGAGKTTLLKLILGLLPLKEGTITIFNRPVQKLGELRSQIGYVLQGNTINRYFPITVEEFILTGRYPLIGMGKKPRIQDYQAVEAVLSKVHLTPLRSKPIRELSGGQWQRMLVARALVSQPRLLLLDEPTTAIDPKGSESLYELLLTLREAKTTIIVVSHDVGVIAQYADTIACLNRTLVCHDRPEEVISAETLETMYGKEVAFFHHGEIPHIVVKKSPHGRQENEERE